MIGYYALLAGELDHGQATEPTSKGMSRHYPIPVAILARLAVDGRHQHRGLGATRLRDALRRVAVVNRANRLVEERGLQPLPLGITPHKLRHTFASILVAIGKDPTYVMQQLGHTDPAFTLRVYSHMMRRSDEEREDLKALVEGRVLAGNRQGTRIPASHGAPEGHFFDQQKSPALAGLLLNRGARI